MDAYNSWLVDIIWYDYSSMNENIYQNKYWEREGLEGRRKPRHPVVAAYVLPKLDIIKRYVELAPHLRLLDVGCGNGFFGSYLAELCELYGVDYSHKMLRMNPIENKFVMDVNQIGFKSEAFDIVFCHALLHHVEDIDRIIQEMRRVSKKYVIILEPNRNNPLMFLFSLAVKEERKALRFSKSYLVRMVERNGLTVIDSFSFGMCTPNKIPICLLPLVNRFNFKQPLGMTNFIIARK